MNGYARCVSLLARSDSSAVSKRYYTVGTYLFTYWLAEQRSPVLAVGLISFASVLSLSLFVKPAP